MAVEIKIKKNPSIFEKKPLAEIYSEIKEVYLGDNRPWVIGFSGGKDSTATLQLVWNAIKQIPIEKRKKTIFVISSDTLVETPMISGSIEKTLEKINAAAKEQTLPIQANKVTPVITDSFWVNMIGKGYPAPSTKFRWCTERLKIRPADQFILDKVSKFGEVVVVLGARKSESASRAQVMGLYKIKDSKLSKHSRFPQTWVYTPVEDFGVNDVWDYLLKNKNPWGNENRDLLALYQSASAGECPLVIDNSTPSCGNSRFGCWVCTVVQKDKSMQSLVDHGEDWLEPLLEIRNFLALTQDPDKKHIYRDYKRRSGRVDFKSDGSGRISRGPYTLQFCKELLRKLLAAENTIKKSRPNMDFTIIKSEELYEIRRIWLTERGDWDDSVPKICGELISRELEWATDDFGTFQVLDKEILETVCEQNPNEGKMISRLMDIERVYRTMARRSSIYQKIGSTLREEWRSEKEVLAEAKSKRPETR